MQGRPSTQVHEWIVRRLLELVPLTVSRCKGSRLLCIRRGSFHRATTVKVDLEADARWLNGVLWGSVMRTRAPWKDMPAP